MIKEYKERLLQVRGFAENTARNYLRGLELFDEYIRDISLNEYGVEECEKIFLSYITGFFLREKNKGKNVKTINLYLCAIRSYLKYCDIQGYNVIDYRKILTYRIGDIKIDALPKEDCDKLLEYLRTVKTKTENQELIKLRNMCIVNRFLYTGLRISELLSLKRTDIENGSFQIIGKGKKIRRLYLSSDCINMMKYYLFRRKDDCEYLFVSHTKNFGIKKITPTSVEMMIRTSAERAGCSKKVFPHMLRHTFATALLRNNVNLPTIQKLLGHSSIRTTQTYLTIENNELKQAQDTLKF